MSFTRIWNREREAIEKSFDRYVALVQQEQDWSPAEESEMHLLCGTLGKGLLDMADDRKVIARARDLQARIDAGKGVGDSGAIASRAIEAHDNETKALIHQRRLERNQLSNAAYHSYEAYSRGCEAKNALVTLMKQNPQLLGDPAVVDPDAHRIGLHPSQMPAAASRPVRRSRASEYLVRAPGLIHAWREGKLAEALAAANNGDAAASESDGLATSDAHTTIDASTTSDVGALAGAATASVIETSSYAAASA